MTPERIHYLKCGEPRVILGLKEDPFTLFYDYDQLCDQKLEKLTPPDKALWLTERIKMTYLEPLRRILKEEDMFERLLRTRPESTINCAFSIAVMAIMLSGVEALGSFMRPDLCLLNPTPNKEIFNAFLRKYMKGWLVNDPAKPLLEGTLIEILWTHFRVGITHGFQIKPPCSLEFLEREPFQFDGKLLRVCPMHFFDDLVLGVGAYFSDLKKDSGALDRFHLRFNIVYPC